MIKIKANAIKFDIIKCNFGIITSCPCEVSINNCDICKLNRIDCNLYTLQAN